MKIAHREGRHPGWAAANRKHKSYPEKLFWKTLKEYEFFDIYTIVDQFPFHGYFFDYAILELKCDIEVDGVQHFRTKDSIEYDNCRDKFTLDNGWIVYRISAKELKEDPHREILGLMAFIESNGKYRKYDPQKVLESMQKYQPIYGSRQDYAEAIKKEYDKKNESIIQKLKGSDIDFSKYGWVSKAAKIIGITPQKVSKWMKRYMPEVYASCYKRKTAL